MTTPTEPTAPTAPTSPDPESSGILPTPGGDPLPMTAPTLEPATTDEGA